MDRIRAIWRRLREADEGMTLVELTVATAMGLVVLGSAATFMTGVLKDQPQIDSKSSGIQQARVAMERLTRELREGSNVSTATASQISVVTYVDSATCGGSASTTAKLCQVTYSCASGACTRAVTNPGTQGSGGPKVVSGLSSNSVFAYSPSAAAPSFVTVTLAFPSRSGSNAITLSDGVALRNYTAATG